jgi:carbonic anhydrase
MQKRITNLARQLVLSAACAAAFGSVHAATVHWCYEGECGPEHWGELDPSFAACRDGLKQTPINLYEMKEVSKPQLSISYKATPLTIKNNGHTIQVNYAEGSTLTVNGVTYRLLQFHFHTPSEHVKNGRTYPMEAHLVHINDNSELAVLGVFLKEGDYDNAFLKPIFDNMPKTEGEVEIAGKSVNVANLLPREHEYFNYSGSLTTPPCSEGVNWMVLDDAVSMSKRQIEQFKAIFEMNARPEQSLNGRTILKIED